MNESIYNWFIRIEVVYIDLKAEDLKKPSREITRQMPAYRTT